MFIVNKLFRFDKAYIHIVESVRINYVSLYTIMK